MPRRSGIRRTNRKVRKNTNRTVKRNNMKRKNTNRKVRKNTNRKVRKNTNRKVRRIRGGWNWSVRHPFGTSKAKVEPYDPASAWIAEKEKRKTTKRWPWQKKHKPAAGLGADGWLGSNTFMDMAAPAPNWAALHREKVAGRERYLEEP
jgi:hypothetical protein